MHEKESEDSAVTKAAAEQLVGSTCARLLVRPPTPARGGEGAQSRRQFFPSSCFDPRYLPHRRFRRRRRPPPPTRHLPRPAPPSPSARARGPLPPASSSSSPGTSARAQGREVRVSSRRAAGGRHSPSAIKAAAAARLELPLGLELLELGDELLLLFLACARAAGGGVELERLLSPVVCAEGEEERGKRSGGSPFLR